ncbi:hypothetical protein, unknown function [Leishmania tarentolae]|uniref:Uncharacterized protein n=1 Tax=Leishmania tarentolae TaxID=5689 RepID=A0A640KG28_LEITA|nr:hypothetical protein, unknown function [Leishmania tarentolae]
MERGCSCRYCGCTMRFCPSCGSALTGKRDSTAKCHIGSHDRLLFSRNSSLPHHSTADCAEGSGASVPWCQGVVDWRQRLPRRAVSAYEVYLAAVHGLVADNGDKEAAASSRVLSGPQSERAAAEDGQHNDEQMRAAALAWLRMMPAEKRAYEEEAQSWQTRLETVDTAPPPAPNTGEDSSLSAVLPDTLPCEERLLPQQQHSLNLVAQRTKTTSERMRRNKSSFSLFRAHMKGRRKMCMRELSAVWRNMSAEEKAPYDAAAASRRTEQLLSQTPLAPGSQL